MAERQIHDMDVIANACPIQGWIIVPEYMNLFLPADRHPRNVGDEISWNSLWIFSDQPALMGPDWIEIAKHGDAPVPRRPKLIAQNVFDNQFCPAIGIG